MPKIAKMAQDYLAIPGIVKKYIYYFNFTNLYNYIASSVSVERIFSSSGHLVSKNRSRLTDATIRMTMCLKSWWKSKHLTEDV